MAQARGVLCSRILLAGCASIIPSHCRWHLMLHWSTGLCLYALIAPGRPKSVVLANPPLNISEHSPPSKHGMVTSKLPCASVVPHCQLPLATDAAPRFGSATSALRGSDQFVHLQCMLQETTSIRRKSGTFPMDLCARTVFSNSTQRPGLQSNWKNPTNVMQLCSHAGRPCRIKKSRL